MFRRIVIYSEGKPYWPHFEPIIRSLLDDHNCRIGYLTSSRDDPGPTFGDERMKAFFTSEGFAQTILFRTIQTDLLVMTMPDFGTFDIKRFACPVHYVNVFHSIVSTHMFYRAAAFDYFDTVFCVGPHHIEEIRAREKSHRLTEKKTAATWLRTSRYDNGSQ